MSIVCWCKLLSSLVVDSRQPVVWIYQMGVGDWGVQSDAVEMCGYASRYDRVRDELAGRQPAALWYHKFSRTRVVVEMYPCHVQDPCGIGLVS